MIILQGELDNFNDDRSFRRIVCLVPSITWLLYDLDLKNEIVGITKFCAAESDAYLSCQKIGGTKNPDIHKINGICPDLIIANKEENRKEDIDALAQNQIVYLSDIKNLNSMYQMMEEIGRLTNKSVICTSIIDSIRNLCSTNFPSVQFHKKIRVAYLIWRNPYMTIGHDTFINYILELSGFENVFAKLSRYPEVSLAQLIESEPEYIFLSSEPYPFTDKHFEEFKPLRSVLVDGRMFSWYGSFILQSFSYLNAFKRKLISKE